MTDKNVSDLCPHCNEKMSHWCPPETSTWDVEYFYVCFNDECSYYRKGWQVIQQSVRAAASYRFRIDPTNGVSGPLPVWSDIALRDGIID